MKHTTKFWVWFTAQKIGFHFYPEAGYEERLEDVSYLGNKHRHLFKFKVWIEVFHNNRDIEFHQALNYFESLFTDFKIDINNKSVEMIAEELYPLLQHKYPNRDVKIEVSEDGECGCLYEFNVPYFTHLKG